MLDYCWLHVFGSRFDAHTFDRLSGVKGAKVGKPKPVKLMGWESKDAPIPAHAAGELAFWTAPLCDFVLPSGVQQSKALENEFLLSYLQECEHLVQLANRVEGEHIECWLVLAYRPARDLRVVKHSLSCEFIAYAARLGISIDSVIEEYS